MSDTYDAVYTRWLNNPENFWAEVAEAVHWHKKWDRVLDDSRPPFYRWFPGGLLNTCYNALDRHVEKGASSGTLCPNWTKSPATVSFSRR